MKRCVIVGGAPIGNYCDIRKRLRADDYLIFCDSGLKHAEALGVVPHLVIGDFDSHERPNTAVETIVLPRVKDDTDTAFAVKEALRRGFEAFLLVGAVGARLDHTLGNVALLLYLDARGKRAQIVDDYSEMEIVSRAPAFVDDSCPYFSLLNISGVARGVTVEHAKYPLHDAQITCEDPYGVSNEVLPGQRARICLTEGRLLLVRVLRE